MSQWKPNGRHQFDCYNRCRKCNLTRRELELERLASGMVISCSRLTKRINDDLRKKKAEEKEKQHTETKELVKRIIASLDTGPILQETPIVHLRNCYEVVSKRREFDSGSDNGQA